MKEIQEQFAAFVTCLRCRVEKKDSSVENLRLYVLSFKAFENHVLFDGEVKNEIKKATSISKVFEVLVDKPTSFIDHEEISH